MSNYNKLAKNSAIFAIGNFGSKFITLLMLPFYTRILSQADYGQIDILITTIALITPIFTVNIVEAVIRFSLDKERYSYEEVLTNSLFFVVLGFLLLIGLYPLATDVSFIGPYALIFYSVLFVQAIHTQIKQFSRSVNLTKIFMLSDLLYTFTFLAFNILFIFGLRLGVEGYFLSMFLAYFIDLIFLNIKTRAYRFIKLSFLDKDKIKEMFIYCIPLLPNALMWWVINISDRYILTHYIGLSANGIYAVANRFPAIIANFHNIFFKAWQVSAIEENDSADKDEFYSNVFRLFFFVMIILSSLYMMFNKPLIKLLVSDEFYSAWRYAPILVLGVVFSSFSVFIGTIYVAMKKTKGALITSMIGAISNVVLNILLIPEYGIYGASIATMVSFLIMWSLRIIDTRKFLKLRYPVFKMGLSLGLILFQLIIIYTEISYMTFLFINLLILITLILISFEYTRKPVTKVYKKALRGFIK